jgi:hypothetical protein
MSLETDMVAVLQGQCPRVHPGSAPLNTPRPFVTWEHIGGDPLRYVDGTAADKRHALVQLNVWAASKAEAWDLALNIENALASYTGFSARPTGAARGRTEQDVEPWLYGAEQDFEILGTR